MHTNVSRRDSRRRPRRQRLGPTTGLHTNGVRRTSRAAIRAGTRHDSRPIRAGASHRLDAIALERQQTFGLKLSLKNQLEPLSPAQTTS
jgi:hypothetical protein